MFIKKKVTTGNDFIYQSSIDGDDYNIERFVDCANAFMQSGATCISLLSYSRKNCKSY